MESGSVADRLSSLTFAALHSNARRGLQLGSILRSASLSYIKVASRVTAPVCCREVSCEFRLSKLFSVWTCTTLCNCSGWQVKLHVQRACHPSQVADGVWSSQHQWTLIFVCCRKYKHEKDSIPAQLYAAFDNDFGEMVTTEIAGV